MRFCIPALLFAVLVAGLKAFVKFAKMLAIGLLLLALFYGTELLLGVAAVASMHERCVFSYHCCDVYMGTLVLQQFFTVLSCVSIYFKLL